MTSSEMTRYGRRRICRPPRCRPHVPNLPSQLAVLVHVDVFSAPSACCCPASTQLAVDLGLDAVARDLLRFGHAAGVQVAVAGSRWMTFGDGMVGDAARPGPRTPAPAARRPCRLMGMTWVTLQRRPWSGCRSCQTPRYAGFGQGLQVVAALDQDAALRRAADAAEEAQGDGDDQRAGAADDQEGQGAHDPVQPVAQEQRRQQKASTSAPMQTAGV